ncbi:hypothetical protein DTL70_29520 [Streptomyces diacarni]|uniref:Uncharacterized protein n=1 Tax=Streptomyces diacarni TaxID=2800381 RepID=A0A367EFX5_9ACTN|nr:hypothetical protein DTL70_29520 [Streptomyces diacarni]
MLRLVIPGPAEGRTARDIWLPSVRRCAPRAIVSRHRIDPLPTRAAASRPAGRRRGRPGVGGGRSGVGGWAAGGRPRGGGRGGGRAGPA